MGGAEGVRVMMAGAALARHRHEGLRFTLFGDEVRITEPRRRRFSALSK